jgi:hypothetical protein
MMMTLTDAGQAVDVGKRERALGHVELDHVKRGVPDLGEKALHGGVGAPTRGVAPGVFGHDVDNVTQQLWYLEQRVIETRLRRLWYIKSAIVPLQNLSISRVLLHCFKFSTVLYVEHSDGQRSRDRCKHVSEVGEKQLEKLSPVKLGLLDFVVLGGRVQRNIPAFALILRLRRDLHHWREAQQTQTGRQLSETVLAAATAIVRLDPALPELLPQEVCGRF